MLRRTCRLSSQTKLNTSFPRPLRCKDFGDDVLQDPLWNKSLAFETIERDRLGLRGLLPPAIRTMEQQCQFTLDQMRRYDTRAQQNLYLQDLHSRNETLFHRVLLENIEELAPLVYTPTVGEVCQKFGQIFRRPRGMFFSTNDRGHFATMTHNWPHDDVHIIVVTDGSRILGLGDLGCQGMGIPIGKLALYCACGGIAPHRVLPITLDVGTNNEALLNDPHYVGVRHRRLEGDEYYDFVDEFMCAVTRRWPEVTVQFEDFETPKALALLKKYRSVYRCFNDDVQGTGAITVAGLLSAAHQAKVNLQDMRVLIAGGGSAGQGVASAIKDALERSGVPAESSRERILIVDHLGAVAGGGGDGGAHSDCDECLAEWRHPKYPDGLSLVDAVKHHKPHAILGMTAFKGAFTEGALRAMLDHCERPIVMPLSNPTTKAECTAEEAYKWTDGRGIVSTGSPFPPVEYDGKKHVISQNNNMYVFPGLGLASSVGGVQRFTDSMFFAASKAVADAVNEEEKAEGRTLPHIKRIREVSHDVAVAVLKDANEQLLTTKIKKHHLRMGLDVHVSRKMYFPEYVPLYSKSGMKAM